VVDSFGVQRAIAILALVSLLAVPLAAWPTDDCCCCDKNCCKSGMCPMHRHRGTKAGETEPLCGEGIQCTCPMPHTQIAPAPPAVLSVPPQMPGPERLETATVAGPSAPARGFVLPPFEPPRLAA